MTRTTFSVLLPLLVLWPLAVFPSSQGEAVVAEGVVVRGGMAHGVGLPRDPGGGRTRPVGADA